MPFQSEKQRRYMHANLPVIANRWEKKYGLGGVAELNAELNSLPEYYLPFPAAQGGRIGFEQGSGPMTFQEYFKGKSKFEINKTREEMIREYEEYLFRQKYGPQDRPNVAQGGLIPAHQAGIYGLAEGGRIGFNAGSMLVAPTTDGSRPGYSDDFEGFAEDTDWSSSEPAESSQASQDNYSDHGAGDPDQFDMTPPTKDPTPDDSDARSKHKIAQSTQKKPYDRTGGEQEWGDWVGGNVNQYGKITPYEGYNISDRMELQAIEKAKQQQRSSMGRTIGKGILTLASFGLLGPTATKLASYYKTGEKIQRAYKTGKVDLNWGPLRTEVDINKVLDPVKARLNKEIDIDPSGLGYGKDLVDKTVIEDTDNGQTDGQTDIQKEGQKIALKRKQEQEWASYLAQLRQEELNRKKQAYLKNYRQSYMSAKGGRVPGYNTGGLSNLFRLKTA